MSNLAEECEKPPAHFGHKPALDGLRAVAVLSVMAYHFGGVDGLKGGFLGVDMFFVLSGYLITSLLIVEWGNKTTIQLAAFWGRRARRLLPALLVVLLAVALWARFGASSDQRDLLRGDTLWTLFYGANWHFIDSGQSYFDLFRDASPLRHAWSLAIEEQFYLVWPLIVFAALRITQGKKMLLSAICIVGIIASGIVMASAYKANDPSRAYYGTDARASQLLIGALLAILMQQWSAQTRRQKVLTQIAGYIAAGFCLWAFVFVDDQSAWLYRGGFIVFAGAIAVVIVAITTPIRSPLTRALSIKWVRWVGAISYGLYLWHWPIQVIFSESRTGLSGWSLTALKVTATFGVSALSYYLIEMPVRRAKFSKSVALVAAPASFILVAVITIVATAGGTSAPRFLTSSPNKILESSNSAGTTLPNISMLPSPILLVGDSVADTIGPALVAEGAKEGLSVTSSARSGCGLIIGIPTAPDGVPVPWGKNCSDGVTEFLTSRIVENNPALVIWHSSWETASRIVDDQFYKFGTKEADTLILKEIDKSVDILRSQGAQVVLMTNPPRAENTSVLARSDEEDAQIEHLNGLFFRYAFTHPEVRVLDLTPIVCPNGSPCGEYVDGVRPRPRDGGHYEGDGPAWVAPKIIKALKDLMAK